MTFLNNVSVVGIHVTGHITFACCGRSQTVDGDDLTVLSCGVCRSMYRLTTVVLRPVQQRFPGLSTVWAIHPETVSLAGRDYGIVPGHPYRVGHDVTGRLFRPESTLLEMKAPTPGGDQTLLVPFSDANLSAEPPKKH